MFDTRKFGRYLSRLRKNADMTQSELADILNLTRQAISRYEIGESFPDISILILIADCFHITVDEMIYAGDPIRAESHILENIARGNSDLAIENFEDVVHLAPFLKPSTLAKLSSSFSKQGIDISNIVALAEYLNDESVVHLLENATFDSVSNELLEKLLPMLDEKSKGVIFEKILSGVIDWHFIGALLPYAGYLTSQIEAAVMEGALPQEALGLLHDNQ